MRRAGTRLEICGFVFCLLAACGASQAEIVQVAVNSNFYSPQHAVTLVGDRITWSLVSGFHNVLADDGSFRCGEGGCSVPADPNGDGDPSFDWGSATLPFNDPGRRAYHCEVHGVGMSGSVTTYRALFADGFESGGATPDEWAPIVPEGDSCGNPMVIKSSVALMPDTLAGASNDTDLTTEGSCLGFAAHGRDRVYQLTLPSGVSMSVTVTPVGIGFDPVLYLVTSAQCATVGPFACLEANDGGGAGQDETLFYTNETAGAVTVYLVVDSANAAQTETGYLLNISLQS